MRRSGKIRRAPGPAPFRQCRWASDDTIHTADDMEKYFGITPLTVVPENQLLFDGVEPEKKSVFKRWRA